MYRLEGDRGVEVKYKRFYRKEDYMSKCIICHERDAIIPDRESGSSRKRVCGECHAERLRGDLEYILYLHKRGIKGGYCGQTEGE